MRMGKAIEYWIFPDKNVFVAKSRRDMSFEEISEHVSDIMADPDFFVGLNGFYDFTATEALTGSLTVFEQLAGEMSDAKVIDKEASTAMLIPKSNSRLRWMMQGYILMTSQSLIDYKIFDPGDMDKALMHVNLRELPVVDI